MTAQRTFRIAIVAGEASGDLLGAGLISVLKKHLPNAEFIGIGGPHMLAQGFQSIFDLQRLSVMGIADVLLRYPELFLIRQKLFKEWIKNPPDVFIGVDYPNFNLSLALRLKRHGIKTVQMVSPKIWAWRQKRVFYIKKAIDIVLTLFPFEEQFYQSHGVPVTFIGHPLADLIDIETDNCAIKKSHGYASDEKIIAVLPGSRVGELKYMTPLFLDVMQEISLLEPEIHFLLPLANPSLSAVFSKHLRMKGYNLKLSIMNGRAREAMALADVVLVKSGTATLEAMLLKRPMVVAFKWAALTHAIIAPQVKLPFISLPNILANKPLVPEFIQSKATPKLIAQSVLQQLYDKDKDMLAAQCTRIHKNLRQNANEKAALAILNLLEIPG